MINRRIFRLPLIKPTLALLLCASFAISVVQAKEVDPLLVKALHQATVDETSQTTDLQKLRWLSQMSAKLERQIPNPFYRVRLLKSVFQEAHNFGLDPQLVLAIIDIESSFNRYAESSAGAQGLMQVMPFWKSVLKQPDADLFNPLTSIQFGCEILRKYLDRYDNAIDALAAYNGSLGRTQYTNKVLRLHKSRWEYTEDNYTEEDQIRVAATDLPQTGG